MPLMALINPEITPVGDDVVEDWEGCLSIPDIRGRVPRARQIVVRAYDRQAASASSSRPADFTARVIQHETDHLDGVLFFDRMTSFETLTFLDEFGRYWTGDADSVKAEYARFRSSARSAPQPLELHLRVIGELHRRGDGGVAGARRRSACASAGRRGGRPGWPCGAVRSSMTCIASRAFMSM